MDTQQFLDFIKAHLPKVIAFRESLTPETDRGCALMAAAFLDSELGRLLRAAWIADSKSADDMLGQSKPLGTFSSRIDLAFLMGLIGRQARRDLHLIRKIRNEFGHVAEPIAFDSTRISAWCLEFYHTSRTKDSDPQSLFTNAVLGALAVIHAATNDMKRALPAEDPHIDDAMRAEKQKCVDTYLESLGEPPEDGDAAQT
jgi:hypothetical protein